ncbi:hypothetical protein [Lewinella sp. 4G2]|uniref:hypothetical protein n=1 Tax=Lewinella sp. 4G2 TaxID=1803372 RepID=UPI0007B4AABD|nr:hypothetical protein [Lewinella sp. 4G2]OAV43831.1 hypothetical protein A3850_004650 [Lewinella sp. 4G2]
MRYSLLLALMVLSTWTYAQEVAVDSTQIPDLRNIERQIAYAFYPDNSIVNRSNSLVVDDRFPESIIHRMRVAANDRIEAQLQENPESYQEKGKTHYANINAAGDEDLAFRLLCRVDFTEGNDQYTVIKYRIEDYSSQSSLVAVTRLKKVDGRWVISSTPTLSQVSLVLLQFKTEFLKEAFATNNFTELIADIAPNFENSKGSVAFSFPNLIDLFYYADSNGGTAAFPFLNNIVTKL